MAVDEERVLRDVRASAERAWDRAPEWHWAGADVDALTPMTNPVMRRERG